MVIGKAGYSIEDCAVMSNEELFLSRNGIRAYELVQFFRERFGDKEDAPSEECLIALRTILYRKVRQTIVEIAGEVDPVYRKVLRNISDLLKRKPDVFQSRSFFNDSLIYHEAWSTRLDLHKPEMPGDELLTALSSQATSDKDTSALIDLLLRFVQEDESYRNAISKSTIAAALREFYLIYSDENDRAEPSTLMNSLEFELPDAIERTIAYLRNEILKKSGTDYERESALYSRTVRSMLEDICQQNVRRLFDYFSEQFPNCSYEEYRKNGRNRFEYVMHQAKEFFFDECKKLLRDGE